MLLLVFCSEKYNFSRMSVNKLMIIYQVINKECLKFTSVKDARAGEQNSKTDLHMSKIYPRHNVFMVFHDRI